MLAFLGLHSHIVRRYPNSLACDLIPTCTNDCGSRCYVATVGDAKVAGAGRIWKFTTRTFAAGAVTIPRRT